MRHVPTGARGVCAGLAGRQLYHIGRGGALVARRLVAASVHASVSASYMNRRLSLVLAVLLTAGAGACAESLDGGAACPKLCPSQTLNVLDTLISPVLAFDSTLVGYPEIGAEQELLLATRGDTLEVRGVIRFDTITTTITPPNDTTQLITQVDSAYLKIILDTAHARIPAQIRFELYDVDDTVETDTLSAPVNARFTPESADRRDHRGEGVPSRNAVRSGVGFRGPRQAVLPRTHAHRPARRRQRSGLDSRRLDVGGSAGATLSYRGSPDTTVDEDQRDSALELSGRNARGGHSRSGLTNYSIVAKNAMPQCASTMQRRRQSGPARVSALQRAVAHRRFLDDRARVADPDAAADPVRRPARHDDHPGAGGARRAAGDRPPPRGEHHFRAGTRRHRLAARSRRGTPGRRSWTCSCSCARGERRTGSCIRRRARSCLRASPENVLPFEASFFDSAQRALAASDDEDLVHTEHHLRGALMRSLSRSAVAAALCLAAPALLRAGRAQHSGIRVSRRRAEHARARHRRLARGLRRELADQSSRTARRHARDGVHAVRSGIPAGSRERR